MPGMPLPPPMVLGWPVPLPLSSTCTVRSCSPYPIRMVAVAAPACLATLVRASWTIRKAAWSTPAGRVLGVPETSVRTFSPAAEARDTSPSRRATLGAGARGGGASSACRSTLSTERSSPSASLLACLIAARAVGLLGAHPRGLQRPLATDPGDLGRAPEHQQPGADADRPGDAWRLRLGADQVGQPHEGGVAEHQGPPGHQPVAADHDVEQREDQRQPDQAVR